jgi:DNA-binding GntR family transcriptional regulator
VSAEHNAHTAITEAIVAGDGALASNRMITHLRAGREFAERANARDGRRAGSRRNGKTTAKKRAR